MRTIDEVIEKLKEEQAFNESAIEKEIGQIIEMLSKHLDEKYEMEKEFAATFEKAFGTLISNVRAGYARDHFDQDPLLPFEDLSQKYSQQDIEDLNRLALSKMTLSKGKIVSE